MVGCGPAYVSQPGSSGGSAPSGTGFVTVNAGVEGVITVTGDVAINPSTGVATAATVNANVGTFGDGSHVARMTVNAKGFITGVTAVQITGTGLLTSGSTGTGFTVDFAASTFNGVIPSANLPALAGDVTGAPGTNVVAQLSGASGTVLITATLLEATQGNAGLTIGQAQALSTSPPVDMIIAPQAPGAAASTTGTGTGANLRVVLPAPVSTGTDAQFRIYRGSNPNPYVSMGSVANGQAAIWLGPNVAPTAAGYFALSTGSTTFIQPGSNSTALNIRMANGVAGGLRLDGGASFFSESPSYGGGVHVVFIANATTNPSTNPAGGGVLYVTAGALTYRGSSGTVTTLGPA